MFEVSPEILRKSLQGSTPVNFSYFKKDGTLRNAYGTLYEKFIPENMRSKDLSANNGDNLKYYDLDKKNWRSLPKGCLLVTLIE